MPSGGTERHVAPGQPATERGSGAEARGTKRQVSAIAAAALVHGWDLVTHNPSDFQGISGLSIVSAAL